MVLGALVILALLLSSMPTLAQTGGAVGGVPVGSIGTTASGLSVVGNVATGAATGAAVGGGIPGAIVGGLLGLATSLIKSFGSIWFQVAGYAYLALWLLHIAVIALIQMIIWVASYNAFQDAFAIQIGWTIVRDIANMFFIIVLLMIAIATILRIERYEWKHHLPRLLLMAVLINFSKTISLLLVDIAQVIMLTFVSTFQGASGNFVDTFGLTKIFMLKEEGVALSEYVFTGLTLPASFVIGSLLLFVTALVLGAMLVVLVGRVIMLWLLVVLSPLAYFASTFPQGEKYHEEWWTEFTKNLLVGPALAFFIWLSLQVVSNIRQGSIRSFFGDPAHVANLPNTTTLGISQIGTFDNIIAFVIATGMFLAGLEMAQKLATIGGAVAGAAAHKIGGMITHPLELAAAGGRFVAWSVAENIAARKLPFPLSMHEWEEGFKRYQEKRQKELRNVRREAAEKRKEAGLPPIITRLAHPADWMNNYLSWRAAIGVTGLDVSKMESPLDLKKITWGGWERYTGSQAKKKIEEYDQQKHKIYGDDGLRDKIKKQRMAIQENLGQVEYNMQKEEARKKVRKVGEQLTNDEVTLTDPQRDRIVQQIKTWKKEIKELREAGLTVQADALEAKAQTLLDALKSGKIAITPEIKLTKDFEKGLEQELERLEKELTELDTMTPISEDAKDKLKADLEVLEAQYKAEKQRLADLEYEADQARLTIDYEGRREFRLDVNKEKSDITTDNWKELRSIIDDAIKEGDPVKAAAALLKATQYGNENEIFNSYGMGSDARGLRNFTEKILVGKLGMSKEDAISVASDVSYIAEGVRHWGTARATNIEAGEHTWADEDDRNIEALAEIQKQDAERVLRDFNRLGWGSEIPPGATDEERMKNFRTTGARTYGHHPYALAYMLDAGQADSLERVLNAGRFNRNAAAIWSQKDRLQELLDYGKSQKASQKYYEQIGRFPSYSGRPPEEEDRFRRASEAIAFLEGIAGRRR